MPKKEGRCGKETPNGDRALGSFLRENPPPLGPSVKKETPNFLTQNRNPNPNTREENGKKREGQENKEENPAPLSSSAKREGVFPFGRKKET